jgi:hypothetical protein
MSDRCRPRVDSPHTGPTALSRRTGQRKVEEGNESTRLGAQMSVSEITDLLKLGYYGTGDQVG